MRVVYSVKLGLIVMSTYMVYRERERSAQRNENKSDREAEGEKIAKETFFCWKNNTKIL